MARRRFAPLALLLAALLPGGAAAQEPQDPAVPRGVAYLRSRVNGAQTGEAALIALAMVKADVPASDPSLQAAIGKVRARFNGSTYAPERSGGADVYEAGVVLLALANLDPVSYKGEIAAAARYLIAQQKSNGAWDYTVRPGNTGDTSISQYAVLGLWEAENSGYDVPARVWDRAAAWYLSVQHSSGGWNYHPDEGQADTVSTTAAGVGSLLICRRQLGLRRGNRDPAATSALLTPLDGEERKASYDASTTAGRINSGIQKGLGWIGSNFAPGGGTMGQSSYYGLYGIERIGALADRDTIGRVDWFEAGRSYISSTQKADGGWQAQHGDVPNTAWAVLFLTKSTAKTLRKITVKKLGSGTLLGGRELPRDLSSLTVAQGRVLVRPMNGAVESMLDVLGDPRAEHAEEALAGLVEKYRTAGPKVLRPHKQRFRKLLRDPDPGVRRVAAWALGRTADLDVAPALISALTDPDESVVGEARTGLQVISRKIDGLGPPPGSTPEQRAEAARQWRAWYDSARAARVEIDPDAALDDASEPTP